MIQVVPGSGPKQHGRVGNDHLGKERYEEAVNAYQKGLSSYQPSEEVDQTYYGLQNNLGVTLHRQQNFEDARHAFDTAISYAPNENAASVASFNAGNNAFTNQQLEAALKHYQSALLSDPENEDAKFNFEFVSRQLQDQKEQQDEQDEEQQDEQDEEQQDEQDEEQQDEQDEEQQGEQDEEQQGEQNEEQQGEQNEEQQGEQDEEQQGEQDEEQQGEQQQNQTLLTMEQAERILEALENEEEELLREVQKIEGRPRRVTKDW